MNTQSGISLAEVLVGLFLSCLILTVLIQCYLSNQGQYIKTQKRLEAHLDLQWVAELFSDSIRRAGFTPCMGISQLNTMDSRDITRPIAEIKIKDTPHSLIQINRMSEQFTSVISIKNVTQLVVSNDILLKSSHPILIADCNHAEVHQILNIDRSGKNVLITLTKPLIFPYSTSTYLGEWFEEQWFIKLNDKKVNTLHYKLYEAEELTPVVHSLKIKHTLIHEKQLIEIEMGLDKNETQKLVVAVRGS